ALSINRVSAGSPSALYGSPESHGLQPGCRGCHPGFTASVFSFLPRISLTLLPHLPPIVFPVLGSCRPPGPVRLLALSSVPDHSRSLFEVEREWSGILGVAEKEGRASVLPAQGRAGGSNA